LTAVTAVTAVIAAATIAEQQLPLPVWHLRIAYDGSNYHGWQIQSNSATVQKTVQQPLQRLFRDPLLTLAGSSRTDTGVHALDQQASFTTTSTLTVTPAKLKQLLNRWMPADVRITSVTLEDPSFHARHSACGKAYTYVLSLGNFCSPFLSRYAWHCDAELNLGAMRLAAQQLVGEHDFASFANSQSVPLQTTWRTLYAVNLQLQAPLLFISVVGSSFMYKMVRNIVGYLVHVGENNITDVQATQQVLAACNRAAAPMPAPAQGLFLDRVFYSEQQRCSYQPTFPPFAVTGFAAESAPVEIFEKTAVPNCCSFVGASSD